MPTPQQPVRHEVPAAYGTTDTYHHGNLRAACVEAGIRLVEEEGPDAVTIRGVARIAGVSHTAPLHHFRDRQELLDAVADRGFDILVERLDASLPRDATPLAALRAYGRVYVDHAVAHRGLFLLMFRPTAEIQGEASYRRLIDSVRLRRPPASCPAAPVPARPGPAMEQRPRPRRPVCHRRASAADT
jgi:AcrR family transcriptional regulator